MSQADKIKVVGKRRRHPAPDPRSYRERARILQEHLDRVHPYPKPRGFVHKARTWEDYGAWREQQSNPRLW